MGYLHEGHLTLIRAAKKVSDIAVVSIFVNPIQFAPNEDLAKYPRDPDRDKSLLKQEGADILFCPDAGEIYPNDFQTYVEVQNITKKFEGEIRPSHFKGVTTVVSILFNAVKPDFAFFGQKDAQQAAVIMQMVKDLKYDIELIIVPIVRENDGLAMSSRNIYLNADERKDALVLNKALRRAEDMINAGENNSSMIISVMEQLINSVKSARLDYVKIVSKETFCEQEFLQKGLEYYILIACRIGTTRLIDNAVVKVE